MVLAQWLERLPVEQKAAGSNPVYHPKAPVKLVYYEACLDKKDAWQREKALKTGFLKTKPV